MASKNPSLNLAQAVQIFAYEVFLASTGDLPPTELEHAEVNEIEAFLRSHHSPIARDWCYALQSRLGDLFEIVAACVFADPVRRTRHRHVGHDLFDDTALHHPAQSPA